jgi:exopolyphosphatase/guanosine-5'-triphosphate,3'-diphosphate pyrophosphatase
LTSARATIETAVMPELVALLDLGSNATRLLLARIQPGDGFRIVRDERVQTRLGSGPSGKLPRAAIALTLESVRRFLAGIGGASPPRVLAVATAAVREAADRRKLLDALRRRNGIDVRILSAEDEGRLGARS